jgi:hypothetical protein
MQPQQYNQGKPPTINPINNSKTIQFNSQPTRKYFGEEKPQDMNMKKSSIFFSTPNIHPQESNTNIQFDFKSKQ